MDLRALFAVCAVWSAAIIVKSIHVMRAGKPYVLSEWDGGLLRAGKQLSAVGTRIKLGVMVLLLAATTLSLAAMIPADTAMWLVIGAATVSLVADFALTEAPRP